MGLVKQRVLVRPVHVPFEPVHVLVRPVHVPFEPVHVLVRLIFSFKIKELRGL